MKKGNGIHRLIGVGIILGYIALQVISSYIGAIIGGLALALDPIEGLDKVTSSDEITEILINSDQIITGLFIGMFIGFFIYLIIMLIINRKKVKENLNYLRNNFGQVLKKTLIYLAITYVFVSAVGMIDMWIFPQYITEIGDNQEMIESAMNGSARIFTILTVTLLAPIIEEYIFRYGLMSKLLYGFNGVVKIIVGTIIFAMIHIGFEQLDSISMLIHLLLSYVPLAIMLSLIYVRENRIIYSILLHIFLNSISTIFIVGQNLG